MADIPSTSDTSDLLPDIISDSKRVSHSHFLPSKCSICTNPAVGYHYDVASCNGCKAFFRRTIITGRRYQCSLRRRCMDDPELLKNIQRSNKRFCGACRFAKCEKMGMNPMSIQAELLTEDGKRMKEDILKRQRRTVSAPMQVISSSDELTTVLQKLKVSEEQLDILHNSTLPEYYGDLRPLSDLLAMFPIFEADKIPNLSFLKDQMYPAHAGYAHNSLLSIVEHAKTLDFFSQLIPDSARKIIIQGAVICRNMIMSYHSIQKFHSDIIRKPDGSIAGKPMRNYNGVWVEHRKIIQKTLHAFMRNRLDHVEYMLLKMIVFCNPAIPGLPATDQKIIETERIRYARCLLTYCFHQHGQLHGPNRYGSILSMVSIMEDQQREQKSFYVLLRSFHRYALFFVSPLYDEIMECT